MTPDIANTSPSIKVAKSSQYQTNQMNTLIKNCCVKVQKLYPATVNASVVNTSTPKKITKPPHNQMNTLTKNCCVEVQKLYQTNSVVNTSTPKKITKPSHNQTNTLNKNCFVKVEKLGLATMTASVANTSPLKRITKPSHNQTNQTSDLTKNCCVNVQKLSLATLIAAVQNTSSLKKIIMSSHNKTNQTKTLNKNCCVKVKKLSLATMNASITNTSPPNGVTKDVLNLSNDNILLKTAKQYNFLQKFVSKKYVTVVDRLKLDFVPLCAENIELCHRKHYKKAPSPNPASAAMMNLVRNSLQQSRYDTFISLVLDLCKNEHFPGDVALSNIVQLLLTLNPESRFDAHLQPILDQLLWLFDVILRTFPPCWLAIRPNYTNFLRHTIQMNKLLPNKSLCAKNTIFEAVLMLLEDTIDNRENSKVRRKAKRKGLNNESSNSLTLFDDEYHNMQHWEQIDKEQHVFSALSKEVRLNRLMQVLHLIAKMMEMDLAMWMLRHHKNPKKHMYTEDQPLVITLFSLSQNSRSSVIGKKVVTLFALCVEKELDEHYLQVMGRFISLLANVHNLCEIETTNDGITYPHIGPATTSFTMDLFKTVEVNVKRDVSVYLRLIRSLRCPFLTYEFIDIFLKRLNPAVGKMCPNKIVDNFRKKRWFDCEPADDGASLQNSRSSKHSIVYRNDYLLLLLEALRSYCDFHGTKEYLHAVRVKEYLHAVRVSESEEVFQAPIERQRIKLNSNTVDLKEMMKTIAELEAKADKSIKLREARPAIPTVDIRVNFELYLQYYNDIKDVLILHAFIQALQSEHDEDFSGLMEFLNEFVP